MARRGRSAELKPRGSATGNGAKDLASSTDERATVSALTITTRDSFTAATTESNRVAGLYFFSLLDCLGDLAYAVSIDFFARPQLYTNLAADSTGELAEAQRIAKLRWRLGKEETVPSKEQRHAIYVPLFGAVEQMNGVANFARLRDDLVAAVTAYSESLFEKGEPMLRERVTRTAVPLRLYLVKRQGASTTWSKDGVLEEFTEGLAYPILRNAGIAGVFGVPPVSEAFPYVEDPNGNQLVEEISARLGYKDASGQPITSERFSNLQRAAISGTEALGTVIDLIDPNDEEAVANLITKAYIWGSALRDVQRGWVEAVPPIAELSSSLPEQA
jgi:hypothetical protein